MNTKRAIVFALILAISILAISSDAVFADQPVKQEYTVYPSGEITDVCTFSVHVDATVVISEIDFFDESGALIRTNNVYHEQDVFSANGKQLVGLPFTFHVEFLFEGGGNLAHIYSSGVTEKIQLPDGSLFISAGRFDFTDHPGATFVLSPDKGNPGNIAGFCAALAP